MTKWPEDHIVLRAESVMAIPDIAMPEAIAIPAAIAMPAML